jgi:hypothetical protein
MSRKVFISSDMSVDERLIEVAESDPQAVLLWPWILTVFDDWGRAEASPKRLKAQVFPCLPTVNHENIAAAIALYAEAGLIITYCVNSKPYMAIPQEKWYRYQTHIRGEKRGAEGSRHPAPPETCARESVQPMQDARDSAHLRADARDDAQEREIAHPVRARRPSPSPSGDANASLAPNAAKAAPSPVKATNPKEPSKPRPRNAYWDAFHALVGYWPTKLKEGAWGTAESAIKREGGTPEDIPKRAERYRLLHPTASLTIPALGANWTECDPALPLPPDVIARQARASPSGASPPAYELFEDQPKRTRQSAPPDLKIIA